MKNTTTKQTKRTRWRRLKAGDVRPKGYQWRGKVGRNTPAGSWMDANADLVGELLYQEETSCCDYRAPVRRKKGQP